MLRAGPRIALTHLGMMRWTGLVLPSGREDCTIVSHSFVLSTMGKSRMSSAHYYCAKKKAFREMRWRIRLLMMHIIISARLRRLITIPMIV